MAFNLVAKGEPIPLDNRVELFLGTIVGAITFSGSVIAYGKLSGTYKLRSFKGHPSYSRANIRSTSPWLDHRWLWRVVCSYAELAAVPDHDRPVVLCWACSSLFRSAARICRWLSRCSIAIQAGLQPELVSR